MTSLGKLKKTWESLAEHDALWAVLTDDSKSGGKWDISEFMATGEAEIDAVMTHLARFGCTPDRGGVALDFGCGVGQLTRALARRFTSCTGVDISRAMIREAHLLNPPPNCRYVVSAQTTLPFADGTFSIVYSNIVLQHSPRTISNEYIREFLRVLAPDGVLVFGVQDSFAAPNLQSLLTRTQHILHLRSRIKTVLHLGSGDMQMHCLPERAVRDALGSARIIDIQITNTGAKDFNGNLVYLRQPPEFGYIGKQYCVRKQP